MVTMKAATEAKKMKENGIPSLTTLSQSFDVMSD